MTENGTHSQDQLCFAHGKPWLALNLKVLPEIKCLSEELRVVLMLRQALSPGNGSKWLWSQRIKS